MVGSSHGRLSLQSSALAGTATPTASSSLFLFPPPFPSFSSAIGATQVLAYYMKNVELHGTDCGEVNFPLGCSTVPDLEPSVLRLVSDRERWEDREARERIKSDCRDAVMAATLAGLKPELVEEERKRFEEFDEAKRKADAAKKNGVIDAAGSSTAPTLDRVREEDIGSSAGQSTAPAVIELDSDSSSFKWDED